MSRCSRASSEGAGKRPLRRVGEASEYHGAAVLCRLFHGFSASGGVKTLALRFIGLD